jgi:tetratricopeptide (TPR) repeat protein
VRSDPSDWRGLASLGLAYVQQARVTADPSYYPKAEGVLAGSLELNAEDNYEAMIGMGALCAARHDFAAALGWGRRAEAINPYNAGVYGVIGDAQVELGRYDEAFASFQKMVDIRPDVASYARASYARELMGDVPGAISAMEGARGFAASPADAAWASYQLGELWFNSGDLASAAREYRRGVALDPEYVPARAGLAKVAWARGDLEKAIAGYTWATERFPAPEYVIALADVYTASGDQGAADAQYRLVEVERRLFASSGVNVDLELALYNADHGDPAAALEAARAEWGRRHSIQVADALGWALYASGDYRQAAVYAKKALGLGYHSASFDFHAGMIQLKLGNTGAARSLLDRAMTTNPHFSIQWAQVAARTLSRLGGAA